MIIIYEVNVTLDAKIEAGYRLKLMPHIDEMLKIDGFEKAEMFQSIREDHRRELVVNYYISSREKLDHYFKHKAAEMRAKMPKQYEGHLEISRRVLIPA